MSIVLIVTFLLGCFLAWSMVRAADKPVPHLSDEGLEYLERNPLDAA